MTIIVKFDNVTQIQYGTAWYGTACITALHASSKKNTTRFCACGTAHANWRLTHPSLRVPYFPHVLYEYECIMIAPVDQVLFAPMVDRLKLVALPDPGIPHVVYTSTSCTALHHNVGGATPQLSAMQDARCKMQASLHPGSSATTAYCPLPVVKFLRCRFLPCIAGSR